jgi:NADH:ubiquinone oxidoreductase subunit 6 (subunit J)
MDIQACLFWIIALLTGLSAIAVVVTQNIVRAATWLLFTLGGTAALYFQIGAHFVGATQLIVYVGGILVLVVFGVMLTAQGPFISMRVGAAEWAIALAVGLVFFGVLAVCVVRTAWPETWFTITDQYIQDLKAHEVPEHVRNQVVFLKGKSYTQEKKFKDDLRRVVDRLYTHYLGTLETAAYEQKRDPGADPDPSFTVTDRYIQDLEKRKVPRDVLDRVLRFKDKSYGTQENFVKNIDDFGKDVWRLLRQDYLHHWNTLVDVANAEKTVDSATLGEAFLGIKDATPMANLTSWAGEGRPPPQRERLAYLLPFEIVSVHLLVVLIGAAYLARAKRRKGTVA